MAPLQALDDPLLKQSGIDLRVLRLDLLCPELSGNKLFKLRQNLLAAKAQGVQYVVSFGGAYSNHLHALAFACKEMGLRCVAVVRGERPELLSPTLQDIENWGAQLHFVSRADYRLRDDKVFQAMLLARYKQAVLIPEGGSNSCAVLGCRDIAEHIKGHLGNNFAAVMLPCGSGGTTAGILAALSPDKTVFSVPVLNGAQTLQQKILALVDEAGLEVRAKLAICDGYQFGGYAKVTKPLAEFIQRFSQQHAIAIEPVYSGKLLYAAFDMAALGLLPKTQPVVVVHTGGMQGLRGMASRMAAMLAE
jgi:1-aminocyclopropane-1-carboxylate deaminase